VHDKNATKQSMSEKLHGIIVPIITPTDEQDRVDEPALRRLVDHLIDSGVHGFLVGGSTGEGPLLSDREWVRMNQIVLGQTRSRVACMGGVQDTSFVRVKWRIAELARIGYRYFVVAPTFYVPIHAASEHLRLFESCRAIADPAMEMIAYNMPYATGSDIAPNTMIELKKRGLIACCKDSSSSLDHDLELLKKAKEAGLDVFIGDSSLLAPTMCAGAVGNIPATANVDPGTFVDAYNAAVKGDWAAVDRLNPMMQRLHRELITSNVCWLAGVKAAAGLQGFGSGNPVSPLEPIPHEKREQLRQLVSTIAARKP
jgi:4-hydroxy-tetrahydrodipicolinate synthase